MTEQQTRPAPFGYTLAVAHRALTGSLHGVLAQAGTTPGTWYALRTIATEGPAISGDALRSVLAQAPSVDAGTTDELIDRLVSEGLIRLDSDRAQRGGGQVELTADGQALYRRLSEPVAELTAQLLRPVDPGDLETTIRVLREVTDRAATLAAD